MKKPMAVAVAALSLAAGSVWLRAQRNDARRTDTLMPPGAIFYLEAKDFHQLLTQWNGSEERRRWLKSDDASVLTQSRLLGRLMQAQEQFAKVASLPLEMNLVNELAGGESAFAFYEFSTVHFVYLTHMDSARLNQSGLWKSRSSYQTREAGGIPFYIKTENDGRENYTVAFAAHDGWLVLATEPNLMAHTLALLAGQQQAGSISGESWYEDTLKQIPQQGDLRLVYNLTALRKSPQFRTYWIQQNITDLGEFSAGSADLFEQANGFEERRVLLRSAARESQADNGALTQVLAHIPQGASLYRAWANPSRELVKSVLQQVVLSETLNAADQNLNAPQVSSDAPTVGSESDLETRIDEPAFQRAGDNNIEALTDAVMAMEPKAILHSQLTQVTGDRVFVYPQSEVSLVCAKADRAAIDTALQSSIGVVKTGSLDPLRISEDSGVLTLSRLGTRTAVKATVVSGEVYAAAYEHAAEWPRYKQLFGVVDHKTGDAPAFFSGNLRSLGDSLYRLRRASMTTQEQGAVTRDTVDYEFAAK